MYVLSLFFPPPFLLSLPLSVGPEVKGAGEISSPETDVSKQQQTTTPCTGECVHVYLYTGGFVAGLDLCVYIILPFSIVVYRRCALI